MTKMRINDDKKLFLTMSITIAAFVTSYLCLSHNIYIIYWQLFYIPIIYACFWYGKRGFLYSVCISIAYFLFDKKYYPEPLWEELEKLLVFIIIGFIVYQLSTSIKKQQLRNVLLNKQMRSDLERFNQAEKLSHLGNYQENLRTGKIVWSDELYRIFGLAPENFDPSANSILNFIHPDDRNFVEKTVEDAIREKISFKLEYRILRKDGTIGWVLSAGYVEIDDDGKAESYTVTLLNITNRKQMEKHLSREKERLRITIDSIGDGVISTDKNGNITILNQVAEKLTGWKQEEAIGKPIESVFHIINVSTREKCVNPIHNVIRSGLIHELADHTVLISRDGTERAIADSAAPIKDSDGEIYGVILVFRDVTKERRKQEEMYFLSYYDSLTGLFNRRYFEEEFKRLDTVKNLPISVIMGDINGLKLINDAFGHVKGDKLLVKAANAIKSACRAEDIAARWGGDEFVILLPKTTREDTVKVVKRIKNTCAKMKTSSLNVSVSLGWDTKETKEESMEKVLKSAEDHMYKHKVLESESMRRNAIDAIFHTIKEKNPNIERHSDRVSKLCQQLGTAMKLSDNDIKELKVSGLLHDIGKVAIADGILHKKGKLTEQEWTEVKRHSDIGYRILNISPEMSDIALYVLSHHERFNGTGYPRGIKQEEIPLPARIIAVADSYDAMTNERPYRKILSKSMAIKELERNKGTQFDPAIVDIFVEKVLNQQC